MAISLANLQRGGASRPPRLLIYGTKGIGKTTVAAGAPGVVFLDLEDGLTSIDVPSFRVKSFEDAMESIAALYNEEHDFRAVAVDSLDWLEPLIWQHVVSTHNASVKTEDKLWSSIEDAGYGKGYAMALDYWRQFLDGLTALRDERGMSIILLAHPEIKRFESPEHEPYDKYKLKLHRSAEAMVQEAVDAVLFANYRVSTVKSDAGFNRKAVRAVGAGDRVLHTSERPAFAAKNRFKMPETLDMQWAAIAQHIPFFRSAS